jgi:hypothetical protein
MTRDYDFLTTLNQIQQMAELILCLKGAKLAHRLQLA